MKVLLLTQWFSGGGLERMVHLLGENLHLHHQASVWRLAFDSHDDPTLRASLEKKGLNCLFWPKKPGFSWAFVWKLMELLRKEQMNVVHTHETGPLMYGVLAVWGCRLLSRIPFLGRRYPRPVLIHTQHSFIHLQHRPFIRFYDRFFSRCADRVIAVSPQVADTYRSMGLEDRLLRMISNGVEILSEPVWGLGEAATRTTIKRQFRTELLETHPDVPRTLEEPRYRDAQWLLAVARIHPKKGQDHLISIWGQLSPASRAQSVLLFLGPETSPGERHRLETWALQQPDHDRIFFLGSSYNPTAWLKAADVFLSGSEYEGMPLAPLEAGGAGLPLLLSEIQGHELLKPWAHFFDWKSPQQAARVWDQLLNSLQCAHASTVLTLMRQREAVKALYSCQAMARQYYELYEEARGAGQKDLSPMQTLGNQSAEASATTEKS